VTPEQLKIFRVQARVLFLERVLLNSAVLTLARTGATLEQAKKMLTDALEGDKEQVEQQLLHRPGYDPVEIALLHDEFSEIVDDLKSYIDSLYE
jgi:predicted RNase H-like HicB family nuclease